MTFNRLKYKRTADVDSLTYHGIPEMTLEYLQSIDKHSMNKPPLWTYIELIDYSGDSQTMRHGDKLNMFNLFSLVYHHNAYMNYNVWEKHKERPLIYLNISYSAEWQFPSVTLESIYSQMLITIHKS